MNEEAGPDTSNRVNATIPVNWSDGVSVAEIQGRDGLTWIVTSPNMDFIPYPATGVIRVCLMLDARYGIVDPVQYPQLLGPEFEFLSAVYRRAPDNHPYHPMWTIPVEVPHFEPIAGSAIRSLGLLSTDFVDPISNLVDAASDQVRQRISQGASPGGNVQFLCWLESSMRHARDRLRVFASTFRDAVLQCAQLQRYWLMCQAFMLFEELTRDTFSPCNLTAIPTHRNLMGAFTTSPDATQRLFRAGIPVWFLRPKTTLPPSVHLSRPQGPRLPSNICTTPMDPQGATLYHGIAGTKHIQATCRSVNLYHDISRAPLLVLEDDHLVAMPQRRYKKMTTVTACKKTSEPAIATCSTSRQSRAYQPYPRVDSSHLRGRDKFFDVPHEWMPPAVPAWDDAMRTVAHRNRTMRAKSSMEIWGYWIPEPSLLLNSQSRKERYIRNWLRARHGWLYLLRVRGSAPTKVPPQWWRDFLYSSPNAHACFDEGSRTAKRKAMINHVFDGVFGENEIDLDSHVPVAWFHHRVDELTPDICPLIIWEMFELGFRYELLALDRCLVPPTANEIAEVQREDLLSAVFPNGGIYALDTLPAEGSGICASLIERRIPVLEALRRVIVRWPRCPSYIQNAIPLATSVDRHYASSIEKEIALFYVRTFFEYGGRAPLIPHQHPTCPTSRTTV